MSSNVVADVSAEPGGRRVVRPVAAWGMVIMLMLCVMINWADKAVFGLIAQPAAKELGLKASQIGFMSSAFFFLFCVTGLTVGFIADRVRIKWVLFALVALWSVVQLPVVFWASAGTLLASRIALGAAEGPSGGLTQASAFEWFPKEKRGLPSSFLIAGTGLAKILIAPVLALLIAAYGWRSAIVALTVLGTAWCVIWLFFGRTGPYAAKRTERDTEPRPAAGPEAAAAPATPAAKVPFRAILFTGTFLGALAATFALNAMATVVLTWLPSYFEVGLGFTRVQSGSLFGLPSVASIALSICVSWFTDRRLARGGSSRKLRSLVSAVALSIGGVLLVLLPYVDGRWTPVALLVFGYGAASLTTPLLYASVSQIAPAAQQASTLSVFTALYGTAGLVAPWLTGMIVDASAKPGAGYALSFQIVGATLLVGALLVVVLMNPGRDAARIEALAQR